MHTLEHPKDPSPTHHDRDSGIDAFMMGILAVGSAVGIPLMFVITLVIARYDGVSWGGSAFISGWGGLVGGPFFGVLVLLAKRVDELDSRSREVDAAAIPLPSEPSRSAA